jgi:hypothetical protein
MKKNLIIVFLLVMAFTLPLYLYCKYESLIAQNELVDFCFLVDIRQEISASDEKVIKQIDLMILTKIVKVRLSQNNLSKSEILILSKRARKLKDSWEKVKPLWVEESDKDYINQLATMGKVENKK